MVLLIMIMNMTLRPILILRYWFRVPEQEATLMYLPQIYYLELPTIGGYAPEIQATLRRGRLCGVLPHSLVLLPCQLHPTEP